MHYWPGSRVQKNSRCVFFARAAKSADTSFIASKVPAPIEVKHLSDVQRPESDNPDFWKVWTNEEERPIDWNKITRELIGAGSSDDDDPTGDAGDPQ